MNRRDLIKGLVAGATLSTSGVALGKVNPFVSARVRTITTACPIWPLYDKGFRFHSVCDLENTKFKYINIVFRSYVSVDNSEYYTLVYFDLSFSATDKITIKDGVFSGKLEDMKSFFGFQYDSFNRFKYDVQQVMKHYKVDESLKQAKDFWGNPLITKKKDLLRKFHS